MSQLTRGFILTALLLLGSAVASSQTGSGTIQGVVQDATGAVIPGAQVKAIHLATAREYSTVTNQVGFYSFPPSQPGNYRVIAETPGMEKWEGSLTLQVSQTASVNPVLRVAGTSTEVVVAGNV